MNLTKFHPQPCAECGHTEKHSDVSGCIAVIGNGWCPCVTYVSPRDRRQETTQGRQEGTQGAERAMYGHAMTQDSSEWLERAQDRLNALIARGTDFTADDVTDVVGVAPSPSAIGALFKAKSFRSRMEPVGFTESSRKIAHARPLRVWKGKAQG